MKKIINGKVYNTESAQEMASWSNGGGWRDFSHCEETLYRKKTGEYFLFGEGGPMTKYAEREGQNGWTGGSRIMPMTYQEAAAWAEEHLSGDEYEDIFGKVAEDDSKKIVAVNLTVTAAETLRRMSEKRNLSASEIVEQLILGSAKPNRRKMYDVREMTLSEMDAELAAVEKRGAAYFPDPVLHTDDETSVLAFLAGRDLEKYTIEEYTVDDDDEFVDGSDYDTAMNFVEKRM